jgi:hypothetical protein
MLPDDVRCCGTGPWTPLRSTHERSAYVDGAMRTNVVSFEQGLAHSARHII